MKTGKVTVIDRFAPVSTELVYEIAARYELRCAEGVCDKGIKKYRMWNERSTLQGEVEYYRAPERSCAQIPIVSLCIEIDADETRPFIEKSSDRVAMLGLLTASINGLPLIVSGSRYLGQRQDALIVVGLGVVLTGVFLYVCCRRLCHQRTDFVLLSEVLAYFRQMSGTNLTNARS